MAQEPKVVMEEVTDPVELETAKAQDERYRQNVAWFVAHAAEIYKAHRGKVVCVAGRQLFVADTPAEVLAAARAAHPDDDGGFVRIIPRDNIPRIYAHPR